MNRLKTTKLKGVVDANKSKAKFTVTHYFPHDKLKHIIEHYWLISWNLLPDESHTQRVIPHPCIHLSFLKNDSKVTGIITNDFEHTLQGKGNLVGVKFTPAGFYLFAQNAKIKLTELTDNIFNIEQFFKIDVKQFETKILGLNKHSDKIKMIEDEVFADIPEIDSNIIKLNHIVKQIEVNKQINKIGDISKLFNIHERQIQRMFNKYIGVNAKWIINRYRIHEAMDRIENENDKNLNWSRLAVKLGYYDQAHFINDFKRLIGQTPLNYYKKA